jgi:hypothetical protein
MTGYVVLTPSGRYAQATTGETLVFDTVRTAECYVWDRDYDGRVLWTIAPSTVESGRLVTDNDLMRFSA